MMVLPPPPLEKETVTLPFAVPVASGNNGEKILLHPAQNRNADTTKQIKIVVTIILFIFFPYSTLMSMLAAFHA
jgi:hypothetical protein